MEVIMRSINITKKGIIGIFASGLLLAGSSVIWGQDSPRDELEEWRSAQREVRNEEREYRRNPTRDNYRGWQDAIRDEQRERAEYQRALQRRGQNANVRYNTGSRFYRVNRGGTYYRTDSRGVEMLRQAVNRGYQQGYQAGVNDRRYRRASNYYNNSIYRSGTFGYSSPVARNQYQHYFQQGFQRGYEDGFNSQTRYGYRTGNSYNILGGVLNTILNIAEAVDNN